LIDSAATQWLARRDRGLTPAEQDAYLQWLQETPAHGSKIARLERAWSRLDALRHWHPAHSSHPNPDLLAPPRRRRWIAPAFFAAAAALAFVAATWWTGTPDPANRRGATIHPRPQQIALEDGSLVELNADAQIETHFTAERRTIRLVRGEAHFAVAKDITRPFVVLADTFSVRAVGTAFAVDLNEDEISVLVTEGKVQLDEMLPHAGRTPAIRELSGIVAGQEAIVRMRLADPSEPRFRIRDITPAEIQTSLAWQTMHLEFVDMPLREVAEEFNRYNGRKLIIEDRATGEIVIGGSFRADNIEPFVRLLDLGFGVSSYPRGNDIVLRRRL
jgi:transmembrane sensor